MKQPFYCAVAVLSASLAINSANATHILGVDVSSAQGSINWATVHANGVEFAFVKATEGNYYEDPDFNINMVNGKAAGVQMGAYDFARPDLISPATEANYFWAFAGGKIIADGKSIFPAVTFEVFNGHVGTSTYSAWFNNWANDVKAKTSHFLHPVIYLPSCTAACDLGSTSLELWVANFNGESPLTGSPWDKYSCTCNPFLTWTYWQYGTGSIGGISGSVDLDVYNGSLSNLIANQGVK